MTLMCWKISIWKNKDIFDKKVSSFNYKLLHSFLTCYKYENKWKTDADKTCIN